MLVAHAVTQSAPVPGRYWLSIHGDTLCTHGFFFIAYYARTVGVCTGECLFIIDVLAERVLVTMFVARVC
jgi:hypothetical protein